MTEIKNGKLKELIQDDKNMNKHNEYGMSLLEKSITEYGLGRSILVDKNNKIIAGNGVTETAGNLGLDDIIIVPTDGKKLVVVKREDIDLDSKEGRSLALADNAVSNVNLEWDEENVKELSYEWNINVKDWGVDVEKEFGSIEEENNIKEKKLSDRFIIPPFSVLDTKQGIWQQRKDYWISLGIKSEEGRNDRITGNLQDIGNLSGLNKNINGISIFDPVLCELAYKWFNIPNGKILDCFAGGSVRGIVASKLGYEYFGNDLRSDQIDANNINAREVLKNNELYPKWTCGDSRNIDKIAYGYEADLLFSCPPYADLEVYSDLKEDISNMNYDKFIAAYSEIIHKSCELLKQDRFAIFVVGDVRDKNGFYYDFISDTKKIFINNGLKLYNELILANNISSLALAASGHMKYRKVTKVHQNVLVFYKGNPKNIKQNYPELDLSYMNDDIVE